jgi:hypothetical protein
MELPELCLPYMANDAGMTSPQARMTHLSWDECKACVLGILASEPLSRDRCAARVDGEDE